MISSIQFLKMDQVSKLRGEWSNQFIISKEPEIARSIAWGQVGVTDRIGTITWEQNNECKLEIKLQLQVPIDN